MLDVRLAPPQQHEQLTLYPLVSNTKTELPYLLMLDALNAGVLEITEKGSGTVPTLIARNMSDQAVLVLDGEQLIGARQNRMTNRSILLPARSETEIPVFCMEHGRWGYTGDSSMKSHAPVSPSKVRRHARTLEARESERGHAPSEKALASAQGEVWNVIADLSTSYGVHSPTGALDHVYDTQAPRIVDVVRSFPAVPDQVGLLAYAGDHALGLDVIGGRELYAKLHSRLLHGYVLDALSQPARASERPSDAAAQQYLELVRVAQRAEAPSVGAGKYVVLSRTVVGGELIDNERLAHLSAFPRTDRVADSPVAPPSRRRFY